MAKELIRVDPAALHAGSDHILNGVDEAAMAFISHEDGLAEAAPGWIGSSQLALGQLAAGWVALHNQHKLRVGSLGFHVGEAMANFVTSEDGSARALRSVQG